MSNDLPRPAGSHIRQARACGLARCIMAPPRIWTLIRGDGTNDKPSFEPGLVRLDEDAYSHLRTIGLSRVNVGQAIDDLVATGEMVLSTESSGIVVAVLAP